MSAARAGHEDVEVLVVGAGFAGIGLGIRLARAGRRSFAILERAEEVGGTWRDNRYPGVACDIPSHLYSFSFRPKPDWSRVFAPGDEIREYLRECVREEGIGPHVRLGTEALEARWDEEEGRWRVRTNRGDWRARVLVLAAGRLADPRVPDLPGLAAFPGRSFHSARWPEGASVAGARVGVVGTGASAVQLLPHVVREAADVVVFQRSAPYVVPRRDRVYSREERELFARDPDALPELRSRLFWRAEEAFPQRLGAPGRIDALRDLARSHLESHVADPVLRAALTPDYEIGCKRVLLSDDYYAALQEPHVRLEPSALERVEGLRAIAASGRAHELDVLVFATGFQSTRPPYARRVVGRRGELLSEHWSHGMRAYASTVVHGFPNMFVLDGPNASLGHNSAIFMIETQVEYVLGALAHLDASARPLEVSAEAEDAYTREIDAASADTVWVRGGCTSWYRDESSGRLTLLWPDFAYAFRDRNGRFDPSPFVPDAAPVVAAASG